MSRYVVTERIDFRDKSPRGELPDVREEMVVWFPGPEDSPTIVDGDYARQALGGRLFEIAIQCGALVEVP